MDKDTMVPEASGISRREMLIGAGVLAAGYGVGQLAVATRTAYGVPGNIAPLAVEPRTTGLPWPAAWIDPAVFEPFARLAAVRNYNRFRQGGG